LLHNQGEFPSLDKVAAQLAMTPRTLRRRLDERNTNFRQITDDVRYQLARQYLQTTTLSIQEIAYLLGYADPSNFGRAFRKWAGTGPSDFRQKPRQ